MSSLPSSDTPLFGRMDQAVDSYYSFAAVGQGQADRTCSMLHAVLCEISLGMGPPSVPVPHTWGGSGRTVVEALAAGLWRTAAAWLPLCPSAMWLAFMPLSCVPCPGWAFQQPLACMPFCTHMTLREQWSQQGDLWMVGDVETMPPAPSCLPHACHLPPLPSLTHHHLHYLHKLCGRLLYLPPSTLLCTCGSCL